MDPGYDIVALDNLKKICEDLNIPLEIYESDIFEVTEKMAKDNPCFICARMRRGFLYKKTEELNCNKLALGHHFDDVVETIMLNVLFSANYKTMMPKLKSDNYDIELIRPMYNIKEKDIIRFSNYTGLNFLDCACNFTKEEQGMRQMIKDLIKNLSEKHPNIADSIFNSSKNVDLDRIISWTKDGERGNFLDD